MSLGDFDRGVARRLGRLERPGLNHFSNLKSQVSFSNKIQMAYKTPGDGSLSLPPAKIIPHLFQVFLGSVLVSTLPSRHRGALVADAGVGRRERARKCVGPAV